MSYDFDKPLALREKPSSLLSPEYTISALVVPRVETVLDDALSVLHLQLKRVSSSLAKSEAGLSGEDTRNLCSVVDAVSKIAREKRQREETEDGEIDILSDEDLEAELARLEAK
jgi:hypothetical protein